jgi:hypothetical protein
MFHALASRTLSRLSLVAPALACALALAAPSAGAQELPKSGVFGLDLVYGTSPNGTSSLFLTVPAASNALLALNAPIVSVPSRWAHRRRLLGALETSMAFVDTGVILTPMGSGVGDGAIHMIDGRRSALTSTLVPTHNPPGYDLALAPSLSYVFAAADAGAAGTELHGFSYATPGTLVPLNPPVLVLPGRPAAYVNRIGYDAASQTLQVPTEQGFQVVQLSASMPHMSAGTFVFTGSASPTTNPSAFERNGVTTWVAGTSTFNPLNVRVAAGFITWTDAGMLDSGTFGSVPSVPTKQWVPAAGCEELAVIGNGTDTYVYYPLREPAPGTFFVKGSAIGVVHVPGTGPAIVGTLPCSDEMGEPFSVPTVSGTRLAFETSFGPPFVFDPADGGERVVILYSPLDPLGSSSPFGVLGMSAPLGGRISTKGMDRPLWTLDGTRVVATTSHFPGAPNPGVPGLEVLEVPADVPVSKFTSPHAVVANPVFPVQSIVFGGLWDPRDPTFANFLGGASFVGNVSNDGVSSALLAGYGELGQKQSDVGTLPLSPAFPNFPAILPPSFEDATGSVVPVPGIFGAHRATFNLLPSAGLAGVTLSAVNGGNLLIQSTGANILSAVGIGPPVPTRTIALPPGWLTTTEFLSL